MSTKLYGPLERKLECGSRKLNFLRTKPFKVIRKKVTETKNASNNFQFHSIFFRITPTMNFNPLFGGVLLSPIFFSPIGFQNLHKNKNNSIVASNSVKQVVVCLYVCPLELF